MKTVVSGLHPHQLGLPCSRNFHKQTERGQKGLGLIKKNY